MPVADKFSKLTASSAILAFVTASASIFAVVTQPVSRLPALIPLPSIANLSTLPAS